MNQNFRRSRFAVVAGTSGWVALALAFYIVVGSHSGPWFYKWSPSIPWVKTGQRTRPVVTWPLPESYKVTPGDLLFGEQQVERMVHDRPEMARMVNSQSPVWKWCVRNFAGVSLGQRIYWNSGKPAPPDSGADHVIPFDGKPGYIRVDEMRRIGTGDAGKASCEELWAKAVFELNNMANDPAFLQIYNDALAGKLDRNRFIERNTRLEYLTELKTELVHKNLWRQSGSEFSGGSYYWGAYIPDTYEMWISAYTDRTSYPWIPFGSYYDEQVVPYLKSVGKMPQ